MRTIAAFLLLCVFWSAAAAQEATPTRTRMQDIFRSVADVFVLTLDDSTWADPRNREVISGRLDALAAASGQLDSHGSALSPGSRLLGASMADLAGEALSSFDGNDLRRARFQVDRMVEYCFACHTREPGAPSALGSGFLIRPDVEALPERSRMTLAVAVRRFDLALDLGERILADPDRDAAEIDYSGVVDDYLRVAVRSGTDPSRPVATLDRFAQRGDVPDYLRRYLDSWRRSLTELADEPGDAPALERARALLDEGRRRNRFPADRDGLVHFLVASRLLNTYAAAADPGPALAEVYYLLGVTSSTLARSFTPPETELYLETAIRQAPASEWAHEAYLLLEEYVVLGYTGSAGVHVPGDVRRHLDELRALLR